MFLSTRTEIAAGIVALMAPGPIHQASDNATFVRKANLLIQASPLWPTRPWTLTEDGDLWAICDSMLQQKGRHAVRVTKVKAHLTDKDVAFGAHFCSEQQM